MLDSIDLRPPSAAARKGMMEIAQGCASCGMSDIGEAILGCLGAEALSAEEVGRWNGRLDELYALASELRPDAQPVKRDYPVQGIRAMIAKGYPRECAWPLWRGFADCSQLPGGLSAEAEETFARFAERLQLPSSNKRRRRGAVCSRRGNFVRSARTADRSYAVGDRALRVSGQRFQNGMRGVPAMRPNRRFHAESTNSLLAASRYRRLFRSFDVLLVFLTGEACRDIDLHRNGAAGIFDAVYRCSVVAVGSDLHTEAASGYQFVRGVKQRLL
ncbi:hypothetical protein [Paenibacillus sp. GYB003]|uniref:hypothetical protein n=1 Tax=Paenibacillus sp. GYB003 TaxID=2994392 RepID=UPI002F96D822